VSYSLISFIALRDNTLISGDKSIEDALALFKESYLKNDFGKSLEILESHKSAIHEGLWHYNKSVIHAKLGQFPLARFHLIKAEKAGFETLELALNKRIIEENLKISNLEKSLGFTDTAIKTSLFSSQGLNLTLALLLLLVAVILWIKKSSKKIISTLMLVSYFFILFNFWIRNWNLGITLNEEQLYEGPSVIFQTNSKLPPGILVVTLKKDQWLKVIYPSRFSGWIKGDQLKDIQ
jgi:hypothetical protein